MDAASVQPGRDVTYAGGAEPVAGEVAPDVAGHAFEAAEEEEDTSWIEIELVDEQGQPVPGEEYEITAPDGTTIRRGHLNQEGQAHVGVPDPGTCQISFPRLDAEAWARAGAAGSQGAGAGTQAPPSAGQSRPAASGGEPAGGPTESPEAAGPASGSESGASAEQAPAAPPPPAAPPSRAIQGQAGSESGPGGAAVQPPGGPDNGDGG